MRRTLLILVVGLLGMSSGMAYTSPGQNDSLLSMMPSSIVGDGWLRTDAVRFYGRQDLFAYIDGGADLFFEYGFRQVAVADFQKEDVGSITIEIYEMYDAPAAFGVYSIRSGEEAKRVDIGQEGCTHSYYVMFWKGRFYVSITASDSSAECIRALETFARTIDQRLPGGGQKPHIINSLQTVHLLKERYFRGRLGLASVRVLEMAQMFPVIDGVVGTYRDHTMIVLRYGNELAARQRLGAISGRLKTDGLFTGYREDPGMISVYDRRGQTVCLGQAGSHIILAISSETSIARSTYLEASARLQRR